MKAANWVLIFVIIWIGGVGGCAKSPSEDSTTAVQEGPAITYSGQLTYNNSYPETPDPSKRYIYALRSDGIAKVFSVDTDGAFSFQVNSSINKLTYGFYTFYDVNDNGKMDYLTDYVTFLINQNAQKGNNAIRVHLLKLSGTIAFDGNSYDASDNRFNFASSTPPVIEITDEAYWRKSYQSVASDGSFTVFVAKRHRINLKLYNVLSSVSNYSEDFQEYLYMPVKLVGVYEYSEDQVLHGAGSETAPIQIHSLYVKIKNDLSFSDYNLMIKVGQSPISYQLYNNKDEAVTGEFQDTGNYSFYFRGFDRTTISDGIFHDISVNTTNSGYGAFFRFQAFIDLNSDGEINPDEPQSPIYYHGDQDGDLGPTWESSGGDWSDSSSDSSILSDINFTTDATNDLVLGWLH